VIAVVKQSMKNFVLIGAGGYIAPKHMKAIKDTGNNLLAALDKNDSVGILDSYFPQANFFTEFERFDRHCEKLRRSGTPIHYVSICSPNYLHDAHCRFGLRIGADVICEKPVVLNPWNVDALADIEKETNKKIFTILQLRQHPAIISLREKLLSNPTGKKYKITLNYITPRGNWYHASWKGDKDKSGGITTNIGIHFFDLLIWLFGDVKTSAVTLHHATTAAGKLEFENAEADWLLSIDAQQLPAGTNENSNSFRRFIIEGEDIRLDEGFTGLHTKAYEEILAGKGPGLSDTKKLIQLLHDMRKGL
jgi:UDP-N-acetyl-2-amino-2-deoxyglucuronate dehydrogenase